MSSIADVFVEVRPDARDFARDTARQAGPAAAKFADVFTRDATGRLRDSRGRFVKSLDDAMGVKREAGRGGRTFGDLFGKSAEGSLYARFNTVGRNVGATLGSSLRVGIGGAAALFVGLAGAGAGLGIKTAAGMEQARISFETMLGSAGKADVFLRNLSDFAAKTPFEFPELQTAASSLISAGIEAGKVIPIMTTLGDVTSGMGTGSEGVKRATIALQQMSAAGRITGEDLNQLRDAGVPVFDLLAAATGKSKAEVVKLAQAGKLGADELAQLMKALESGKGLERFSGLMDKQSQSLTGLWSTFKDTLGMGLAKLLAPAIPALKSGLGQVTKLIDGAFKGISVFFDALRGESEVNEFEGGLRAVNNIGVRLAEWLPKIGRVIRDDVAPAAVKFGRFLGGVVVPALFRLGAAVAERVIPVLRGLADFVANRVAPVVMKIARQVAPAAGKAFAAIGKKVEENRPQLESLLRGFRNVADFIVTKVVPILGPILSATFEQFGWVVGKALDAIGFLVDGFHSVVRGLGNMTAFAFRAFRTFLEVALAAFEGILGGAAKGLGWIPGIGDKLKGADQAFTDFKDRTLATLDAMALAADAAGEKTAKNIKEGFARVIGPDGLVTTVTITPNGRLFEQAAPAKRALGGPVTAGMPYIVGERRPELFVPDRDGRIEPRVPSTSGPRGGGAGMSDKDMRRFARLIAEAIAQLAAPAIGRAAASGANAGLGANAVNLGRA